MTAAAVVIEAAIAYLTGVIGMARPHKMPQLVVITGCWSLLRMIAHSGVPVV